MLQPYRPAGSRMPFGPGGWQMCMGLYAASQSISLIVSPNIFINNPLWQTMSGFGVNQYTWGALLGSYAICSLACLFRWDRFKLAALAAVGIPLWIFLGSEMLWSSYQARFISASGIFELIAGIGCGVCLVQWSK